MKTVLITGGEGDIAKAMAHALSQTGKYDIYCPGRKEMDVTSTESVNDFVQKVKPDILINNAGYITLVPISENRMDYEKKSIDINLFGVFNCTGAVLAVKKDALIINIGSSAGTKLHADWSSYCATKAAVIMATRCWAAEGVKTVCISPGRTASKMRKGLFPDENQNTLLKAEQFADVVLMAINGKFAYGENIDVNVNNIQNFNEK